MNSNCSFVMKLPELNCLKPNEHTTFKKLVEEIAECNNALEDLNSLERRHNSNWLLFGDLKTKHVRKEYKRRLNNVLFEIMDIAQVCASQLFVFEKLGLDINNMFKKYAKKKSLKKDTIFYKKNNCRYVFLYRENKEDSLQVTMNKIIFCMGNIAQIEKLTGKNGEIPIIQENEANEKYIYNLFDIIQYCFDLLFTMKSKYIININKLFKNHINKLIKKGYYKEIDSKEEIAG